ncbi:MAG: HEAT repeat domain-containing protein [Lachnospiraceae bacterium]|nr:HEAT repeat domain-containing protein [Lachnospiraceae bacterium]
MIKEYYQNIENSVQTRANLIALRRELKDEKNRRALASLLGGDFTLLSSLLQDEDPKVRKNAALILGEMESEDLLPVLFDAYKKEDTLYVRADYLKAISRLEYRPVVDALKKRLDQLRKMEVSVEEQKHVSEEMRVLQAMVMKYEKRQPHRFTGYSAKKDMILVTNRCQREATARQLPGGRITMLAGGVRVKGAAVEDVLPIRTYSELLFPLELSSLALDQPAKNGRELAPAVLSLARELHQGQKLSPARELHQGQEPFLFRIELKGRISPEKKGACIRRIAEAIERASDGGLVNSVTEYELEIRLLERKDGTYVPMVKLFTIPQKRFSYRKQFIASSIAPVNAALTAELARPYLKEGAQILDPFCGVGTMLIERHRAVRAGTMYGIDIYGEAIDKARDNTVRAGEQIYYINKDFFEFEHTYLFDEIITDMPQVTAGKDREQIRQLYRKFFQKAGGHLKRDGVMILYASEPGLVSDMLGAHPEYKLTARFTLNEKNGTGVFIIHWRDTGK